MKKLKKVIIPVAGLGTRLLPMTKAITKEMLPIAGKPVIQYIVNEAIDAGFSEIIFVSRSDKTLLTNYFKTDHKLEASLEKKSEKSLLIELKKISRHRSKMFWVEQKEAKGLGHAILCAKHLISNEPFAVILPDMLLNSNYKKNNLTLMKNSFEKSGESCLLLGKVKRSEVQNYGIVKIKNKIQKNKLFPLEDVVEKPSPKKAPSVLFVAGRYIFDNEILGFLSKEKPDSSGEIQLTGAISNFLKASNAINGLILDGDIYDCGNKLGYLIANLAFSFKDRNIKREVLKFMKK